MSGSHADEYACDIVARTRWARDHNAGEPKGAWSTGEKEAVALVLDNQDYLDAVGTTRQQAGSRLAGGRGRREARSPRQRRRRGVRALPRGHRSPRTVRGTG